MAGKKTTTPRRMTTFRLPEGLLDQARQAAYWSRRSMTEVVERALAEWVAETQVRYNRGLPFTADPAGR